MQTNILKRFGVDKLIKNLKQSFSKFKQTFLNFLENTSQNKYCSGRYFNTMLSHFLFDLFDMAHRPTEEVPDPVNQYKKNVQ